MSRHVMVTFHGRGMLVRPNRDGSMPEASLAGYRLAHYQFDAQKPDVTVRESIFGLALLRHLASGGVPVDTLYVLGTRGSTWDDLVASALGTREIAGLEELREAQDRSDPNEELVSPEMLEPFRAAVEARFRGEGLATEARFEIIDYVKSPAEQVGFMAKLGGLLRDGDRVTLDITHALRYLTMLGAFAAAALRPVRPFEIASIYYGALDLTPPDGSGPTPVLRLDGVMDIVDWLVAYETFKATGDYGTFAPLLEGSSSTIALAEALRQASFLDRVGSLTSARRSLEHCLALLDELPPSSVPGLFAPVVRKEIAWIGQRGRYLSLREKADRALTRRDLVRAAEFLYEAYQERLRHHFGKQAQANVRAKGDKTVRDAVLRECEQIYKGEYRRQFVPAAEERDFDGWNRRLIREGNHAARQRHSQRILRQLRNRLAHLDYETSVIDEVTEALGNHAACAEQLLKCKFDLLPEDKNASFFPPPP